MDVRDALREFMDERDIEFRETLRAAHWKSIGTDDLCAFALRADEPERLRIGALELLKLPDGLSVLGDLLPLLADPSDPIALNAMELFHRFPKDAAGIVPKILTRLEELVAHHASHAVCLRAMALVETFGELDAVERLLLLPSRDRAMTEAARHAVESIVARPRSVRALRAENFERLVAHLLRAMGHRDVERASEPHDGGIDITSRCRVGERDLCVAVQCKRYGHGQRVSRRELAEFAAAIGRRQNGVAFDEGLFVATCDATTGAHAATETLLHRQSQGVDRALPGLLIDLRAAGTVPVRIVEGHELVRLLNQQFGESAYKL